MKIEICDYACEKLKQNVCDFCSDVNPSCDANH